jgi:hypothetical protein
MIGRPVGQLPTPTTEPEFSRRLRIKMARAPSFRLELGPGVVIAANAGGPLGLHGFAYGCGSGTHGVVTQPASAHFPQFLASFTMEDSSDNATRLPRSHLKVLVASP